MMTTQLSRCVLLSLASVVVTPLVGHTQDAVTREQVFQFDIVPGAMSRALSGFSEVSGVQLVYSSDLVDGLQSSGLSGEFSATDALARILDRSGLVARFTSATTATLVRDASDNARTLGPVRVEGVSTPGLAGINGSTDATATEGTKSYTSGAISIASKTPQSIRNTPQSVSVITSERIEDQNLTSIASALRQTTGITLVSTSSSTSNFFSRGFRISSFQIDGGAPIDWLESPPDLAQYDHVEVLRGANGIFNGFGGDPGGTINLVRKRPLDHSQVKLSGYAGSWNNYRTEVDIAGPLGYDGKLRGRFVAAYEDRDYFYDVAETNKALLYAIVEASLSPDSLLSFGGSFDRTNHPGYWANGLPRYATGPDLKLPRDTCLCFPWNRWNFETPELFAEFEQRFGNDWSARVKVTRISQDSSIKYAISKFAVSIDPPVLPTLMGGSQYVHSGEQLVLDLGLSGKFDLFGLEQALTIGADWRDSDSTNAAYLPAAGFGGLVDVLHFDPSSVAEPATPYPYNTSESDNTQSGVYATLRLQVLKGLYFPLGIRYSKYRTRTLSNDRNEAGEITDTSIYGYRDSAVATPQLSAVYELSPAWSLYASYADIYQSQANKLKAPYPPGGDPLKPVTGVNYEVGAKAELYDGRLNLSLATYHVVKRNEGMHDSSVVGGPGPSPGTNCCYVIGHAESSSQGFELEASGGVRPGWQLYGGYTFNRQKYKAHEGNSAAVRGYTPKHLFKLWSTFRLPGAMSRWNVGSGVNAQTASHSTGAGCLEYEYYPEFDSYYCSQEVRFEFSQGFYAVFNTRAEYQIDSKWSAALNVNNIFDRVYYQNTGHTEEYNWYGEPRSFMLTLRGTF